MNGEKLEKGFADLDNAEGCSLIHSYIFIPLYGIKGRKNGILQLYNKKEGDINKTDANGFELLQHMLGRLLDSIIELSGALDFMLTAKVAIANIMKEPNYQNTDIGGEYEENIRVANILRTIDRISETLNIKWGQ